MLKKPDEIDRKLMQLLEDIKKLPPEHAKAFIEGYTKWKRAKER